MPARTRARYDESATGAGLLFLNEGDANFSGLTFAGADRAIECPHGVLAASHCDFVGLTQGAVIIAHIYQVSFDHCNFRDNHSYQGGAVNLSDNDFGGQFDSPIASSPATALSRAVQSI